MRIKPDILNFPDVLEQKVETQRPVNLQSNRQQSNLDQMEEITEWCQQQAAQVRKCGFESGAIVSFKLSDHRACILPYNWGVVTRVCEFAKTKEDYKQLHVLWFQHTRRENLFDMDELYMIMPAPNKEDLQMMLELQDLEARELLKGGC